MNMDTNDDIGFAPEDDALVDQLVDALRIMEEHDPIMRALLDDLADRIALRLIREVLAEGNEGPNA